MKIYNFGIDWLSLTNVLQMSGGSEPLMKMFIALSGITDKWVGFGYKGYQDVDTGLKYGSRIRKDSLADELLILSGNQAESALDSMPSLARYRATRLDLQVTVLLDKPHPKIVTGLYEKIATMISLGNAPTGRRKVKMVRSETGDTLYVGSRKTGRKFFRLYDKSLFYGEELGMVWRQEIQYGRDMAKDALALYLSIKGSEAAVINLVCAEFKDGLGFSILPDNGLPDNIPVAKLKKEPPMRKKLQWLEECVRPTITLMINNDLEAEMLEALGLTATDYWANVYIKRSIGHDND